MLKRRPMLGGGTTVADDAYGALACFAVIGRLRQSRHWP